MGFMTLGCSLHEILTTIKAQVKAFPRFQLYHDDIRPIESPVHLVLPDNGLRLQFDGPDQRLRLVEVLDFTKAKLVYKDMDVFRSSEAASASGPSFRHIYDKLLGPTYGGEYRPPTSEDPNARGTYNLSYPGVAFNFPVQHAAYSPKKDFISLLSSSTTGPATSMAVFAGESWQKARSTLFTAPPPNPRSISVAKSKEGPDEIELIKIHGQGKIELIRRSSPPFFITLSETTPQDLIMELGAPDSIYRKSDHRLSIHNHRRSSDASELSPLGLDDEDSDHASSSSALPTDHEDAWSESSSAALSSHDRHLAAVDHFYNYYHHGFDILISHPTHSSPNFPTQTPQPSHHHHHHHLTATKIVLHGNIPGSYQFNRHRRSRWSLAHIPAQDENQDQQPFHLTSELPFSSLTTALQRAFHSYYHSDEQERLQQRGMALNRGWGDSPGSSCELLGSMEDSDVDGGGGGHRRQKDRRGGSGDDGFMGSVGTVVFQGQDQENAAAAASNSIASEVGNVELFGFPGLIFEVLKNGAVSALTVY